MIEEIKMARPFKKLKNGIKIPKKGVKIPRQISRESLEAPAEMFNGIQMKPKLPVGLAEHAGLDFDSAFRIGGKNAKDTFASKVGVDIGFGTKDYDIGFSKAFMQGEFMSDQPALISQNYGEPSEYAMESQYNKDVPNVIDATKKIGIGKRIPLTDEEESKRRRREVIPRSGLADVRVKQLEAGSNFLSNEEQRLFEAGYTLDGERYDTRRRSLVGSGL